MAQMSGMSALRAQRVRETSPSLTSTPCTRKAEMPEMQAGRWPLVVALLVDPERESARLARLLERLPAVRRRHLIPDDNRRG